MFPIISESFKEIKQSSPEERYYTNCHNIKTGTKRVTIHILATTYVQALVAADQVTKKNHSEQTTNQH